MQGTDLALIAAGRSAPLPAGLLGSDPGIAAPVVDTAGVLGTALRESRPRAGVSTGSPAAILVWEAGVAEGRSTVTAQSVPLVLGWKGLELSAGAAAVDELAAALGGTLLGAELNGKPGPRKLLMARLSASVKVSGNLLPLIRCQTSNSASLATASSWPHCLPSV